METVVPRTCVRVKPYAEWAVALGVNIRAARVAAGHTQESIATALRMHVRSVSQWEVGRCTPTFFNLLEFARVAKTTVSRLTEGVQ